MYHLEHAEKWFLRLGDGTAFSHQKMQAALDTLMPYAVNCFEASVYEDQLNQFYDFPHPLDLLDDWQTYMESLTTKATLSLPDYQTVQRFQFSPVSCGHTEYLAYLLGEMQSVARQIPHAKNW